MNYIKPNLVVWNMKKLLISFSARENGNCDEIAKYLDQEEDNNAKTEESAMAVVMCNGKILVTNEMIYGKATLSLPKGHTEENESSLESSIRECYEETNVVINETNLVKKLTPYSYEFLTPSNKLIRKTLIPYLFEIYDFGNPLSKEERIMSAEWMSIEEFLLGCPY